MPSSCLLYPGNNSIKFKTKMPHSLLAKRHFVDRASLLRLGRSKNKKYPRFWFETQILASTFIWCYIFFVILFLPEMADQCLFDFLHMEIVSHVYKEQQSNKGQVDSKVPIGLLCMHILQLYYKIGVHLDHWQLLAKYPDVLCPGWSSLHFCPWESGLQGGTRTHWEVPWSYWEVIPP